MPEPTPPQTVGPFFAIGLPWDDGPDVVARGSEGAVVLRGTVYDGDGEPVLDPERFFEAVDAEGALVGFYYFEETAKGSRSGLDCGPT